MVLRQPDQYEQQLRDIENQISCLEREITDPTADWHELAARAARVEGELQQIHEQARDQDKVKELEDRLDRVNERIQIERNLPEPWEHTWEENWEQDETRER